MKFILAALIILLSVGAPAMSAQSMAPIFHNYLSSTLGIPIVSVSLAVDPPTNPAAQVTIQYQPSATPAQIAAGNAAIASFNWTPPAIPNIAGFVQGVRTEPSFNSQIRIGLGSLIGLLQADVNNATAAQQDWDDAVSTYGSTWLTPSVQTTILNYATANNIPIHASP